MQVLGFLYLSLKCANSENSFIFKTGKKRKNINTQIYYTNQMKLHLGSYRNIPELDEQAGRVHADGLQCWACWAVVPVLTSGLTCKLPITPASAQTCLLV